MIVSNSEDLTQDDKNDLENRLSQFLKDPDPEIDLNLDGDLRKINFIFKKMKKIINLGGSIDHTVINGSDQIVAGQIGNRQSKQFQITPEEIIRLKDILEQRDAEIAVLVFLFLFLRRVLSSHSDPITEERKAKTEILARVIQSIKVYR